MALDPITGIAELGSKIIDKIFPDKAQAEQAKIELFKAQQAGQLDEISARLSAIVAEAKSSDPWTSRARPSFMYVMYALILWSIPMGVLSAFRPEMAVQIATGMKAWLASLPAELWWTFGVGYTGYTAFRSIYDKPKTECK